ncbi:MAG: hypothetical protein RI964_739 [Pseudomonadota bacterium]|jgi:hypothetical protein
MLELHGVFLLLLWLIAVAGIFFAARWLSRFLRQTQLPTDIQVLILVAFVGLLFIATLNILWGNTPDKNTSAPHANPALLTTNAAKTTQPNNLTALDAFESAAYPALYGLRQQMLAQLNTLDQFVNQVPRWATQMPAQRQFLQKILDIRWERRKKLKAAYHAIDMSRREFWVHYNAGQNAHVRKMFDSEALHLQKSIQNALGDSREAQQAEIAVIADYLYDCGTLLKQKTLPPTVKTSSKIQGKAFSSPYIPTFEVYGETNYRTLRAWLIQHQENGIVSNLEQLRQEETQIRSKIGYILEYRQLNTDLTTQVNQLVIRWNDALKFNQYTQYRLLFATEALALTEILGAPNNANQEDAISLVIQVRSQAAILLQDAQQERLVAEFSYQPDIEHRSSKSKTTK